MSTITSSTDPLTHVTYFACPGGTSAKWIPRRTPFAETEALAWTRSRRCPTASVKTGSLNHSRKAPRSSPRMRGVNTQAPSMDSGSTCMRVSWIASCP